MADGTRREAQQAGHAVLRGTTSIAGGSEEEARCVRFLTRITPAMVSLSILASDTYRSPRRRTTFERTTAVTMALRLFGTRDLLHDIRGRCNLGWHGNSWRHTIGDRHASTGQETAGHTNADAAGMAAADPANSEAWTRNSDVFSGGASRSYTPYAQTRQFDTALEEQRSILLRQPCSYSRDSLAQKGGALIGWLCGLAAPQTCGSGAIGARAGLTFSCDTNLDLGDGS